MRIQDQSRLYFQYTPPINYECRSDVKKKERKRKRLEKIDILNYTFISTQCYRYLCAMDTSLPLSMDFRTLASFS